MKHSKSRKNASEKTLSHKVRSSLVLKLNLRMMGMLLSAFIVFNLLGSLLYFGVVLWKAETGGRQIMELYGVSAISAEAQTTSMLGYEMIRVDISGNGLLFPAVVQQRLPLEAEDARRWIDAPGLLPWVTLQERIDETHYHVTFSTGNDRIQITYGLGDDLRIYIRLLLVVLTAQLLYLLGSLRENTRVIRKTLKPLSDLADTARNLQKEAASAVSLSGNSLKTLTGTISTIDARRLDRRIAVDQAQHELKDLAQAINGMLNRIHQTYETQRRFVADASHELRTPISVIQGYANLLDRWGKQDEKVMQEGIDAIRSETESMKNLVEQLLFLARGDNDTIHLNREVFDACDLVAEVIREAQLIHTGHIFETRFKQPARLWADKPLIKQAIRILVDNSIKYTPAGENITLKVWQEDRRVNIQVQDNGIGISPEDVAHIFNRFYRSDESRARKTGGAGLGLAIAKWIIERHEGQYEVISRLHIGTRTTLLLPSADRKTAPHSPD